MIRWELPMPRSRLFPRRTAGWLVGLAMTGAAATSFAAERSFPFDSELMLDAKPMKGSKRVPVIGIGPRPAG